MVDEAGGGQEQQGILSREMVAPTHLEEGVNFFSYPPFEDPIKKALGVTSVEEADTRTALAMIAKMPDRDENIDELIGKQLWNTDWFSRFRSKYTNEKWRTAIKTVLKDLKEYPDWTEYVKSHCWGKYGTDGTFKSRHGKFVADPSYPAWLFERIQREQRLREAGVIMTVAEAFPQQMGGASVTEAMRQAGVPNSRKKWRMLKSSGIVPSS